MSYAVAPFWWGMGMAIDGPCVAAVAGDRDEPCLGSKLLLPGLARPLTAVYPCFPHPGTDGSLVSLSQRWSMSF